MYYVINTTQRTFLVLSCLVLSCLVLKVIDQDGDSWLALDSGVQSVAAKALLWLWDMEKLAASNHSQNGRKPATILLITANDHYAPFMALLKQRG
jgi:hypothetical protein